MIGWLVALCLGVCRWAYTCWETRDILFHGRLQPDEAWARYRDNVRKHIEMHSHVSSIVRGDVVDDFDDQHATHLRAHHAAFEALKPGPLGLVCPCGAVGLHACPIPLAPESMRYSQLASPPAHALFVCPFCGNSNVHALCTCGARVRSVDGSNLVYWERATS